LHEDTDLSERDGIIKRATIPGKVTLLTRTFGRGIDFVCRDEQYIANGGLHVLQTFFSVEKAEEIQIMGRCARQGDNGSYEILILKSTLDRLIGSDWATELPKLESSAKGLYYELDLLRDKKFTQACLTKRSSISTFRSKHVRSKYFMAMLNDLSDPSSLEGIKLFLIQENRGPTISVGSKGFSRTLILMDGTGSMGGLIAAAVSVICDVFERAKVILTDKDIPPESYQVQCAVYRDYDCKAAGILESSNWDSKPETLRQFLKPIKAYGGGDGPEAVEIGFQFALKQENLSQIILLADAPAKDVGAIRSDRNKPSNGGAASFNEKFGPETHFSTELAKLTEKGIPVHAFYLNTYAEENFKKIKEGSVPGSRCEFLDVNNPQFADSFLDIVCEEILRCTANASGLEGEEVVQSYQRKYRRI
jgi:hypothetical protein